VKARFVAGLRLQPRANEVGVLMSILPLTSGTLRGIGCAFSRLPNFSFAGIHLLAEYQGRVVIIYDSEATYTFKG
jgi:hypothetical protein